MRQIATAYTIGSGTNVVTLTGVNVPQSQILSIINVTVGRVVINQDPGANGGVLTFPSAYTAAANSTITVPLSILVMGTTDKLLIIYDDGNLAPTVSSGTPNQSNFTSTASAALLAVMGADRPMVTAAAITIKAIGRNARETINVLLDETCIPVFGGEGGVADYSARGTKTSKWVNRRSGSEVRSARTARWPALDGR